MIHLSTASGSVIAQILGEKLLGDSYVSTASGDITVYIPSNVGVTIRAENEGASRTEAIVSDFQSVQVRLNGGTAVAVGPINGGGPVLRLEGTGGTIWIRKK
jgi:Flp pilus assembly protein TadG